ncbi:MAG: sigma-70 family RNA polymerase sigma factor [Planctomycetes bacterium]|nr:sigma-70 family RNA polymerase sigma factor [Planctomycetota bacterium]
MPSRDEITRLLNDLRSGKDGAEEAVLPMVYDELRALARQYMRHERPGHTLQTTALVHEAYLKLGGESDSTWESKSHFLRVAARAMRNVLIDHARRKRSAKRGGDRVREPLDRAVDLFEASAELDLVALDSALEGLGAIEKQMVDIVELRFFGGFTLEETAKILGISKTTVKQDWTLARAWLKQKIA